MTKKILKGKVIKDKNDKTIVVLVKRRFSHPFFECFLFVCFRILDRFWSDFSSILAPFLVILADLFQASFLHRFFIDFPWFWAWPNHHFIWKNKAFPYFSPFPKKLKKTKILAPFSPHV